jgi:hypothetical protein
MLRPETFQTEMQADKRGPLGGFVSVCGRSRGQAEIKTRDLPVTRKISACVRNEFNPDYIPTKRR